MGAEATAGGLEVKCYRGPRQSHVNESGQVMDVHVDDAKRRRNADLERVDGEEIVVLG
jgi:hypothetical protein